MKILMTADTVGGVWKYALDLADALAPHAVDVVLATMGRALTRAQRSQVARMRNVQVHESQYRLEWQDDPWDDVDAAGDWLLDLAARVDPDVVHLNGYAHAALSWDVPAFVVAHSCVRSWWRSVRKESAPNRWRTYTQRVTTGLRAARAVVAPSRSMLSALEAEYEWTAGDTAFVIPYGRSDRTYRPVSKEQFVLTAGPLWDEAKNVRTVADAAPMMAWPVCAAGDTRAPDGAEVALPSGAVQSLGRLDQQQLADWMSRASIFALPARYEPFGRSTLEAAHSGCALVLGDIPSLREVWDDTALYVDPSSPADVARAVNTLVNHDAARGTLAVRAHQRAKMLTPERVVQQYLRLYEELAVGGAATDGGSGDAPGPELS